jgi:ABC-type dipeptide/oligopeptide/nickel transport system permease component
MVQRFIVKRVLIALLQLIGISLVVFFVIRGLGADPVARIVGMNATAEAVQQAKETLGLHESQMQQLANYLGIFRTTTREGIIQGSLGESWVTGSPIFEEVTRFLPITLELITYALLIAFLLALPLGMSSGTRPGGAADKFTFVWGLFAGSQPEFWWGLMFVFVFFFVFQDFGLPSAPAPLGRINPLLTAPDPITGFIMIDSLLRGRFDVWIDAGKHLMLPVFTLVFVVSGPIVKMVRQNMLRVLRSDYILYARSAGLPNKKVARYALRAALAPAMTLTAIIYGFLLGGAVPVELIYSLGGIGEYSIRSILNLDFPAIQGTVLVIAMVSLLIYLAIDILHAFLDPRITF